MLCWTLLGLFAVMIEGNTEKRLPTDRSSSNRTARSLPCPPHEYLNDGLCCKNCPAGTHVSSHCTMDHGPGTCLPCTPGNDFTAGPNGLETCVKCHPCRFKDQVQVGECTQMRDYECQCRANTFCTNTCLFCKDCTRCPEGKVVKVACTPTSDTVCENVSSALLTTPSVTPNDAQTLDGDIQALAVVLPCVGIIFAVAVFFFLRYWRKKLKVKKKQAGNANTIYENPHCGDSLETVSCLIPAVQEQVNNIQAEEIEFKSDKLLTDTEWYECYTSLREHVPPSSWKEMMRHLGLSEVDIESIRLSHSDVREMNYQMLLLWRIQNGRAASMGKLLRVLDKMNLRGCKENVANSLTGKGIPIV